MKAFGCGGVAMLLVWAAPAALAETKAWQDTITLPTWLEGPPEAAPRLDSFDPDRSLYSHANYPYATRTNFTKQQQPREWRRLNLENEYLACSFLPDLGGHLYTCIDKLNGRPIFRANPSIKKADIGVRGAWVALGIEWSFPVAHSRDTASPVNFGFRQDKGRAVVWVGNVDRLTGMEWLAEFVLRDGSAVLEENVTLRNPTAVRHPYLWWANANIVLGPGTRFVYPARVMASPGMTELQPWPLDKHGVDLGNPANVKESLALFAYGSREPFFAVYDSASRTAAVHVADPAVVTGKKLWTWGANVQPKIRALLSDDNATYVEMQAGLFTNQETYQQLQPHTQVQFTELWLAARDLSGVTRANGQAILSFARQSTGGKSALLTELDVTQAIPGAHIRILSGTTVVQDDKADLIPSTAYTHSIPDPGKGPYRFELRDSAGKLVIAHTEGAYETIAPSDVKMGPQPPATPGPQRAKPDDYLAAAEYNEQNSQFQLAESVYLEGVTRFPKDGLLLKSIGRLLVEQQRYPEAAERLSQAAVIRPADSELRYYLGVSLARIGKEDESRKAFAAALTDAQFGPPSMVEMAVLESRAEHSDAALGLAVKAIERNKASLTPRKLQVALLRRGGKPDEARQRVEEARAVDPLDSFLRLEAVQLGQKDDTLWSHLAADPARVLEIAATYFEFGMYRDAMTVLDHTYTAAPENQTEPGSVLPQDYPLVAYYRGYCRQKLGQSADADFKLASSQRLEYVFPNRADTVPVLEAAIHANTQDASAHFLLGLLYLNDNSTAPAVAELQAARAIRKDIPELYFVLGRALLPAKEGRSAAVSVLQEGIQAAPSNQELKNLLAEAVRPPKLSAKLPSAPAPAPASVSARFEGKRPGTPAEIAAFLLTRAAVGDFSDFGLFSAGNFPQEKQPDSIRQAYVEVQLQNLRKLLAVRNCTQALGGAETIGDENKALPFTLYGFEEWMKGARFQYYLGAVEAGCGGEKAARRRWSKVAKMTPPITSSDAAFPLVAAQNLALNGKANFQPMLDKIAAALADSESDSKGALLYSQGILLIAKGDQPAAVHAFQEGAASPDHAMSHYLNTLALNEAGPAAPPKK